VRFLITLSLTVVDPELDDVDDPASLVEAPLVPEAGGNGAHESIRRYFATSRSGSRLEVYLTHCLPPLVREGGEETE
jgi:hypothetical protein